MPNEVDLVRSWERRRKRPCLRFTRPFPRDYEATVHSLAQKLERPHRVENPLLTDQSASEENGWGPRPRPRRAVPPRFVRIRHHEKPTLRPKASPFSNLITGEYEYAVCIPEEHARRELESVMP